MSTRIKGLFSKKKKDEKSPSTSSTSLSSSSTASRVGIKNIPPSSTSTRSHNGTLSSRTSTATTTTKKTSATNNGASSSDNLSHLRGQHSTTSLNSASSFTSSATNVSRKPSRQGLNAVSSATSGISRAGVSRSASQTSLVSSTSKGGKFVTQSRAGQAMTTKDSHASATSPSVPTTTATTAPAASADPADITVAATGTEVTAEDTPTALAATDTATTATIKGTHDGTTTPLSAEAAIHEDEVATSSLTRPSTPSTLAPSSTTHDDTKEGGGKESTAVESMIEELDIVKVSHQDGASYPEDVAPNNQTLAADAMDTVDQEGGEEVPEGEPTETPAQDAPESSYIEHGSFYSNISLRDHPDTDDIVDGDNARQYPRYLTSTAEFFPVHAQDERVFLERYTEDTEGLPELQHKVGKLQRQVKEMRKFMRGMIQLQVEQYEPAAIKIQAWWRGCLVRKELRRQRVFSWHRVVSKNVKAFKYLTRTELQQSCDRISAPKPSIFVTPEMGAAKEVIAAVKLQAVFRACLVRRRLQAYHRGTKAAIKIQAAWRGYYTRNLDTRLSVKQLQFRNLKVQKAFGRVSLKLQYLQGRIATLEESYPVLQDAQDGLTKDFDDLSDEVDKLRKDLEQGLKQMDEQAAEERELMTLELKAMTDRVKKLEDDLAKAHGSQTSMETQISKLQKMVTRLTMSGGGLEGDMDMEDGIDNEDEDEQEEDDYEVQYDDEGNRIERPSKAAARRPSSNSLVARPSSSLSARGSHDLRMITRRTSNIYGGAAGGGTPPVGPSSYSESDSPIPAQSMLHRGSISSLHSHHSNSGNGAHHPPPPPHPTRQASMPVTTRRSSSSTPGSPDQVLPRGSLPSSYSPTIANAQVHPPQSRSHSRQGSVPFPNTDGNNSFSGGSHAPHHHHQHPLHNHHRHSMMAAFPPTGSAAAQQPAAAAAAVIDTKKFASHDDFEYMQAEVDTLRINNDKLEALVRDLTVKVNMLMGVASSGGNSIHSSTTPILSSAHMPGGVMSGAGGYFPPR